MNSISRFTGRRAVLAVLCVGALLTLASMPLFAQSSSTGRISGVAHDPSGAVITGAAVTVTSDGTHAQYTTKTSSEGSFLVPSLPSGLYTVQIEAAGFTTAVYDQVKVDTGKDYSLTAVLKLGKTSETVEVSAGQELVNTTSSEVSHVVDANQTTSLPLNGRGVIGYLGTQPNVTAAAADRTGTTTIAGARPSWSQVTLDGINIQDIFIRTNALDFIPNRPSTEAVSEFTVTQGAQGADAALGANSVRMVTTSGSNAFHGRAYEFNRNSALAANSWFRNHNNPVTPNPLLNRNEYGANVGGPIVKNRLFFFFDYEALRNHARAVLNSVIPAHDDYLQGVFRYVRPSDGSIQAVNIINLLPGVSIDPKIQSAFLAKVISASHVNNFDKGNSTATRLLNTAGFSQNQGSNVDRDVFQGKIDFEASSRHHFDFSSEHVHETTLRPDLDPINLTPLVTNDSVPKLFSGGWRWTVKDNLINSVRIGSNYANAPFNSSFKNTDGFLFNNNGNAAIAATSSGNFVSGINVQDTQVFFQPQGRIPTIHQYSDDATWVKGNHSITFGGQFQKQNVDSFDFGINPYVLGPIVTTGFSTSAPANIQLTAGLFPGGSISSTDLAAANNLRAFLGGIVSRLDQQFYVTSKTSGFVQGARNDRNLTVNDLSFYGQDKWHVRPNLTINYGVKWEYFTPYKEINGLQLGPVFANAGNPSATLLDPNATVDFLKQAYKPDRNNFGPTIGFAWDPFKNGKTSVRGGYSLTYVNDDTFRFAGNAADGNAGLGSSITQTGLFTTLSNLQAIPTPVFKMPRTLADQLAVSTTSALFALDPNVRTPYVHEISFGIQREIVKNTSLEVRYVGTLARDLLRGKDLNQTNAGVNQAWLADFARARSNGFLSQAAGKGFVAAFNPAVAGSQPLTILAGPTLGPSGGLLTNSTVITDLQQNQAAALADLYVQNRATFPGAPGLFLPNPGIYAADLGANASFSSYHSMVVELNKRLSNGLQLQANYTWSKLITDSPTGDSGQTRFDALLDNARPNLQKSVADYDLRQALKVNAIYDLPFGKGKMFLSNANSFVDRVLGGWQLSGIWSLQSGAPFSILSTRGTFNRGGRSGVQTAVSTLTQSQINQHLGVFQAANGNVYYIDPTLADPTTGRGVGPDTLSQAAATNFNQQFFNPTAGNVGNLGLLAFQGPAFTDLDMGLAKNTKITERVNLQLRVDAFNLPNHPTFFIGDQEINSTQFGRITSTNAPSRVVQIGGRIQF